MNGYRDDRALLRFNLPRLQKTWYLTYPPGIPVQYSIIFLMRTNHNFYYLGFICIHHLQNKDSLILQPSIPDYSALGESHSLYKSVL